jgi:hypothetical protein
MAHGINLVESLRRDPAKLLTNLAKCEQGQAAIRAGAHLIGDILDSCTSSAPAQPKLSAPWPAPGLERSSPITSQGGELPSLNGGSSSVEIVGITSLAVIAGSVALLGTVSIVALNRRGA